MTSAEKRFGAFFVIAVLIGIACSGGSGPGFFSRSEEEELPFPPEGENPFEAQSGVAQGTVSSTVASASASGSGGGGGACDSCNDVINGVAMTISNLCAGASQAAWDAVATCVCGTSTCNMAGVGGAPPCESECVNPFPFSSACTSCAQSECGPELTTCLSN